MKAPKTQGWYTFADGYRGWFYGLGALEKKVLIRDHGKIISFTHTTV